MSETAGDTGEQPTNEQPAAQAVKPRKFLSPAALAQFLGALEVGRGNTPIAGARALQETGTAQGTKARRDAKRTRREKKEG